MRNKYKFLFSALTLVAVGISGCGEVVEDTTNTPVPVNLADVNSSSAKENRVDSVISNEEDRTQLVNSSEAASQKEDNDQGVIVLPSEATRQTEDTESDVVGSVLPSNALNEDNNNSYSKTPVAISSNENRESSSKNCSDIPESEIIGAASSLNDSADMSASLLRTSKSLLSLSESMIQAGSYSNVAYISAMYALSQDISTMANRVGEMSDRILTMSDKIVEMSEKIVKTQTLQNENITLTQKNILKAQENFSSLLQLH